MGWGSIYQSNGRSIIYGMGVFKVRVGQAKGIGRVHYFWDRALLFIGMGE